MKRTAEKLPLQPWLFDEPTVREFIASKDARMKAGKAVVDKLLKLRRTMEGLELEHLPEINSFIEKLRAKTRFTDSQREELVLLAIERHGATTLTEISEDTRIAKDAVKEIVVGLGKRGVLYQVPRYVPGSDRPQYAIKSHRVRLPEAGELR